MLPMNEMERVLMGWEVILGFLCERLLLPHSMEYTNQLDSLYRAVEKNKEQSE